jgi:hypothetical protein
MPGFVPGIHVFTSAGRKTWMAGTKGHSRPSSTGHARPRRDNGRIFPRRKGASLIRGLASDIGLRIFSDRIMRRTENLVVSRSETPLDIRHRYGNVLPSRSPRDLSRGCFRKWNGSGPRARRHEPRPGGFGHQSRRYYGRRGRCSPWTGTGEGG